MVFVWKLWLHHRDSSVDVTENVDLAWAKTHIWLILINTYTHKHVNIYSCALIHTTHIHIHIHTHIHIHVHLHISIHKHKHIHIHIHTYITMQYVYTIHIRQIHARAIYINAWRSLSICNINVGNDLSASPLRPGCKACFHGLLAVKGTSTGKQSAIIMCIIISYHISESICFIIGHVTHHTL